jgi:hypothetical protein
MHVVGEEQRVECIDARSVESGRFFKKILPLEETVGV